MSLDLPKHYERIDQREAKVPEDLKPTPGIVASECADPHLADDMRRVNQHRRWQAARKKKR